jgi:hypothetical protein
VEEVVEREQQDNQVVLVVVEEEIVEMLVELEIPHQYPHHKEILVEQELLQLGLVVLVEEVQVVQELVEVVELQHQKLVEMVVLEQLLLLVEHQPYMLAAAGEVLKEQDQQLEDNQDLVEVVWVLLTLLQIPELQHLELMQLVEVVVEELFKGHHQVLVATVVLELSLSVIKLDH